MPSRSSEVLSLRRRALCRCQVSRSSEAATVSAWTAVRFSLIRTLVVQATARA